MLRWSDPDHPSNDHGLAIDDFSLTPHGAVLTDPTASGSANPSSVAAGESTLLTVNVTPGSAPPSTGLAVTGDLTTIGGSAAAAFFDDGTNGDVTAGDNIFSLQATVAGATSPGSKSLTITVTDEQARTAHTSINLTVTPPAVQTIPIHTIQGNGSTSPLTGQVVATSGIVTGVKSNGFYIEAPDAEADADPASSEGIFVFTSAAPPATAAVGNLVTVTGPCRSSSRAAIRTARPRRNSSARCDGHVDGQPAADGDHPDRRRHEPVGLDRATGEVEGMRVQVNSLTVIAPTGGTVNEANATSTSNGVFYGVITGVARPFREPGVEVPDPLPAGSPAGVPRFDANPERLRVDTRRSSAASR